MHLLAICMSSLVKCLFRFVHFLTGFFVFMILSCMSCLYSLEIIPDRLLHLQIFSPIVLDLFMISFAVQKLLSLIKSCLFIYFFCLFIFAFVFIF